MDGRRVVDHHQPRTRACGAHGDVDVLPVEEVLLVEASRQFPHGSRDEHARAADPRQPPCRGLLPPPPRAAHRTVVQIDVHPGEPHATVRVDHAGRGEGQVVRRGIQQSGDGTAVDTGVRVEEQEVGGTEHVERVRGAGVHPAAEAGVRRHRDEVPAPRGAERRHGLPLRRRGQIVDDDDPGLRNIGGRGDEVRLEQSGGAVIDDDHREDPRAHPCSSLAAREDQPGAACGYSEGYIRRRLGELSCQRSERRWDACSRRRSRPKGRRPIPATSTDHSVGRWPRSRHTGQRGVHPDRCRPDRHLAARDLVFDPRIRPARPRLRARLRRWPARAADRLRIVGGRVARPLLRCDQARDHPSRGARLLVPVLRPSGRLAARPAGVRGFGQRVLLRDHRRRLPPPRAPSAAPSSAR
ncbi:unnamed protein product [Penicillium discolor]